MSLPELSSYSSSEIQELESFSTAFKQYRHTQDFRHQEWCKCVAATYFERSSAKSVCEHWSDVAMRLLTEAGAALQQKHPQNRLCIYALGKLGARELNLSSDVDLIAIGDEDAAPLIKEFQSTVQKKFRLDWDLRPGGRLGPLVSSPDQFEDYYGNYGESWERLALTRMNMIFADSEFAKRIATFAEKFCYRRHLDYRLLDDLKIMRERVHQSSQNLPAHIDLKLCIGGIRDLELFTHTLLVIHGGKNPNLRTRSTEQALLNLKAQGLVPEAEADFLIQHYWNLRQLENLVQAQNDLQTHLLSLDWLSQSRFDKKTLTKDLQACDQIVSSLLGQVSQKKTALPISTEDQTTWLKKLGASDTTIQDTWPAILKTPMLSRDPSRDKIFRDAFLFNMAEEFAKAPEHFDRSMIYLSEFLQATRAKAPFYRLFLQYPKLFQRIGDLFARSPYLTRLLIQRPELLDSFILRTGELTTSGDLSEALVDRKLMAELIAGAEFLDHKDLQAVCDNLTSVADEIVQILLESILKDFPTAQLSILALGKWGGREVGFRSDLDFVLVTQAQPAEAEMKVARRLFNRLSETHRGGNLYQVDMRLKPSESTGILLTSLDQLEKFLSETAPAWQRQAYLRARWIGPPKKILSSATGGLSAADLEELQRIQKELRKDSLKLREGGLIDIEFAAQISLLKLKTQAAGPSTLEMIHQLRSLDTEWKQAGLQLAENYIFLRTIEQLYHLITFSSDNFDITQADSRKAIAAILQLSDKELLSKCELALSENCRLLMKVDPRQRPH